MTAPPKIPAWLLRHLAQTGDIAQGFTRRARVGTCRICHQPVIRGWTEEPCAILATCDPQPLSDVGEALALLQGRDTFDLARRAGRHELDLREEDHIHGSPPERPDQWRARGDVLASHRCPTDPPAAQLPTIESRIP